MKNFKNPIITKRIKAFAIDYLIILMYIGLLLGTTLLISKLFDVRLDNVDTATAELIGFFTLTLPVILYFTFSEAGRHSGSIGKRKFGLKVVSGKFTGTSVSRLFLRNFIKFLPWEIAHFFIFQLLYFLRTDPQPPVWVFAGLIISQLIAIIYLLFMIFNKNNQSLYEIASSTRVVIRQS